MDPASLEQQEQEKRLGLGLSLKHASGGSSDVGPQIVGPMCRGLVTGEREQGPRGPAEHCFMVHLRNLSNFFFLGKKHT